MTTRTEIINDEYMRVHVSSDWLPYTPFFDRLYNAIQRRLKESGLVQYANRNRFFRDLTNRRKAKLLASLNGETNFLPPDGKVTDEQFAALSQWYKQRGVLVDAMPYTEIFDEFLAEARKVGVNVNQGAFWAMAIRWRKRRSGPRSLPKFEKRGYTGRRVPAGGGPGRHW